jgi:DNA invertase Pin-like site-specific DNA recombinase
MNYVIYARTNRRDVDGNRDIARQADRCRQLVYGLGGDVVALFEDHASGVAAAPPALGRLLEEAQLGRVEHVVVSDVTRLGRDVRRVQLLLAHLAELGVDVRVAPPRSGDLL